MVRAGEIPEGRGFSRMSLNTTMLVVGGLVTLGISYLFQIIAVRNRTADEYAEIAVMMSMISLLGLLAFPVRTHVLTYFARDEIDPDGSIHQRPPAFRNYIKFSLKATVVVLLVAFLIAPAFTIEFKSLVTLVIFAVPMTLSGYVSGALLGLKRERLLVVVGILYSLGKLSCGIILVFFDLPNWFLFVGISASTTLIVCCAIGLIAKSDQSLPELTMRWALPPLYGIATILLFSQADIIGLGLIRRDSVSSRYAAAAVIGKVVLLVAVSISDLIQPKLLDSRTSTEERVRLQVESYVGILVSGIVVTIVLWLAGERIVPTLLGSSYSDLGKLPALLAIVGTLQGLSICAGYFLISHGKANRLWLFAAGNIFILMMSRYLVSSELQLLFVALVVSLVLFPIIGIRV
jgi:O-antigen/teichoic acid export membrane protein